MTKKPTKSSKSTKNRKNATKSTKKGTKMTTQTTTEPTVGLGEPIDPRGEVLAWHWLPYGGKLRWGDGREPKDGEWLVGGEPLLCQSGMHGSVRLIDALSFAPGTLLCRVALRGNVALGYDKCVALERKIVWRIDTIDILGPFVDWCLGRANAVVSGREPPRAYSDERNAQEQWLLEAVKAARGGSLE